MTHLSIRDILSCLLFAAVTPTKETQDLIDGICQPGAVPTATEQALRLEGDVLVCSTPDGGVLSLYDASGRLLQREQVSSGEARVAAEARGFVIASLDTGIRAFARKLIIR